MIRELNENINTPITTEKVELSLWQEFPHITLSFHHIEIKESIRGNRYPLARLEKLHLAFNPFQLAKGSYIIDQVYLQQGEVTIRHTSEGEPNYNIFKKSTKHKDSLDLAFDLQKINLRQIKVNYVDERRKQTYLLLAHQATAKLTLERDLYSIPVTGQVSVEKIQIQDQTYFRNKELKLDTYLTYHQKTEMLTFKPSSLYFSGGQYELTGTYDLSRSIMDLQLVGQNTKFEHVIGFLADEYAKPLQPYRTKGDLFFTASLQGPFTAYQNPTINIQFGSANSSFYHPDYKATIESASFSGNFTNGNKQSLKTSSISLNELSAVLDGRQLKGKLKVYDFTDYKVDMQLTGSADFNRLYAFTGHKLLYDSKGLVQFDFQLNGRLADFEKSNTINKVRTSGQLTASDVSFKVKDYGLPFNDFSGEFLFSKSDLAINRLSGKIGNSDVHLKGLFLNAISFLLFEKQALAMEADLSANFIDMDELLSGSVQDKNKTVEGDQAYSFYIPDNLTINFSAKVGQIKFRRFRGKQISSQLKVRNQRLSANEVSVKVGGGVINLDAVVNASQSNHITVDAFSRYAGIQLDSAFYIFEDFNQDWLTHRHLKGGIFAEVNSQMAFDNKLNIKSETIKATIAASIKNGELNNFEPMQELSRFVAEDELANLRFYELKNEILVENKTIYLPEMEIHSNVSRLLVNGKHTFDQQIDYRLVVPLKTLRKKDKDEAFGAIEEDGRGGGRLYVSIIGSTDDYKISWDGKRTVRELGSGLKKEKEALKNILKKEKDQKKKEVQPSEDEFFDF